MKKIALPLEGEMIHGHFGGAKLFKFYTVEDKNIVDTELKVPPPHTPGAIPRWIAENEVTDLIICGIGQKAVSILEHHNVKVMKGVAVKKADELVKDYLEGVLETSNENCGGHGHHGHHDHDHHH
jgi:predicted Fe-Mo cluster-binding NifX family protein